jgi:hypothetical protein
LQQQQQQQLQQIMGYGEVPQQATESVKDEVSSWVNG